METVNPMNDEPVHSFFRSSGVSLFVFIKDPPLLLALLWRGVSFFSVIVIQNHPTPGTPKLKRVMILSLDTSITLFVKDELETNQSIVLSVESSDTIASIRNTLSTRLNTTDTTATTTTTTTTTHHNITLRFKGTVLQPHQLVSECGLGNNAKLHYTLSTPLETCRGSDPRPLKRGTWGTQAEEDRWIGAAHQNLLRSGAMNPLLNHSSPCSTPSTPSTPSTARPCIPKIIHQIWLGSPRPATADYIKWFDSWQTFHPEWEIRWWHDKEVQDMIQNNALYNVDAYNKATNYGEKSDILRYEIIAKYGGLYVDTDMECTQSFDKLHDTPCCSFYAGWSNTGTIELNNGIFGAMPNHVVLQEMIQSIHRNHDKEISQQQQQQQQEKEKLKQQQMSQVNSLLAGFLGNAQDAAHFMEATMPSDTNNKWSRLMKTIEQTGPGLFTKHVLNYMALVTGNGGNEGGGGGGGSNEESKETPVMAPVVVLPMAVFYPVPNNVGVVTEEIRKKHVVPGKTLAIHHWAKSWQQEDEEKPKGQ
jgi:hypothetical protein